MSLQQQQLQQQRQRQLRAARRQPPRTEPAGNPEILNEPYCSPLLASDEMLKGLPETLIISAGHDNFRFEDDQYALRLIGVGVKVTARRFLDSYHGFLVHCTGEWEEAQNLVIHTIRQASL